MSAYNVGNPVEDLQKNIDAELAMISELSDYVNRFESYGQIQGKMFFQIINSLRTRIRFVNNSIPEILNHISLAQPLNKLREQDYNKLREQKVKGNQALTKYQNKSIIQKKSLGNEQSKETAVEKVKFPSEENMIVVRREDKRSFLRELNISEGLIKRLKKKKLIDDKKELELKKPRYYAKLANRYFFNVSDVWVKRGNFKSLSLNLRRSNLNILTTTYISMMILTTMLSIFAGIFLFIFFMFFNLGFDLPFVSVYKGNYIERFLKTFWIIIAVPIFTAVSFYFFPTAEKDSIAKKIDQELPFLVIHMSSISGSGIEPSEIFKITGLSKEYKYARKEVRKVINQTNIYGYDLTTALRNVALATPSAKLAELLNGISITINSGGDIRTFFEKRGESLLLEYRLEREKFTKTAETFMDIYISIVIAAPMILLMLLVMISVSGIQTGFSVNQLTFAIIGLVAVMNMIFLTFLHLKQPSY